MSKTWSITEKRSIIKRIVVEGATEKEALKNYTNDKWICDEDVDEFNHIFIDIEEDISE